MIARRILILLLMWLIPLYSALAGASVHLPASAHTMQMSQATDSQVMHDCCDTAQSADHSLKISSNCTSGNCTYHSAVSLPRAADAVIPVQISFAHPMQGIVSLSSITLETPSRPPSLH